MLNGRAHTARRIVAGASLSALILTVGVQSVSHAEPTIDEVEQRVDALYRDAEVAQERLNGVRYRLAGKRDRLQTLQRELAAQRDLVDRMGDAVGLTIAEQAQTASFGPTGRLLLSEDPDEFIDGMVAAQSFNAAQGAMLDELATESERLEQRQQQVEAKVTELAADRRHIAKQKATVEAKLAQAKDLLAELEAEERARLRRQRQRAAAAAAAAAAEAATARAADVSDAAAAPRSDEAEPSRGRDREPIVEPPASGLGSTAVAAAMAEVGDAYVYGAAGPDAWDCSGLTMGAWAAAGVSLPHSSTAQLSSGTPVSQSQLQPGDLVFYYSPISHVGMYIGNGQIVHAANPSTGVQVTSLGSMPFSGAVRPG